MELQQFYVMGVSGRGSKRWWDQANAAIDDCPERMRSFIARRGDQWCNLSHEELMPFVEWAEAIPRKEKSQPPLTVIDRESEKWLSNHKFAEAIDRFMLDRETNRHRKISSAALGTVGVEIEIYPDEEGDGWTASVGPFGNGSTIDGHGATAHEALFDLYDVLRPPRR